MVFLFQCHVMLTFWLSDIISGLEFSCFRFLTSRVPSVLCYMGCREWQTKVKTPCDDLGEHPDGRIFNSDLFVNNYIIVAL